MNKGFHRKITELDKLNYELDSIDEKFESYVDAVSGYADTVEELEDELLVYNEKLDWSRRKGLIDPSLEDHIYSIADLLEEAGEKVNELAVSTIISLRQSMLLRVLLQSLYLFLPSRILLTRN